MTGAFSEAIHSAGITPPAALTADGALHRFHVEGDRSRAENGWYVLFDDPPAGAFGCWKRGISETWSGKPTHALTLAEKAAYRAKMEVAKQQREAERARVQAEAREKAKTIWEQAQPAMADHPYLLEKVVGPHGLRLFNGSLVVPMRGSDNTLRGLQFIDGDGKKRFLTGTAKAGSYFAMGGRPDDVLYVCEGFATGASIHEATKKPVAVAFDAGNLLSVAEALREKLPGVNIIICGDHDHSGTGQKAANTAALAVNGLVAIPPEEGQDFNDLALQHGQEAVRSVIEAAGLPATDHLEERPDAEQGTELPLLFDEINTPDIPSDLLPGWMGEYAGAVARYTQTPTAMAVMLSLAVVATCAAKRFEVTPHGEGYSEPLNTWPVVILGPGNRKTAVISALTAPLNDWELAEAERLAPQINEVNTTRKIASKRIEKLEKEAANTSDPAVREDRRREILQLQNDTPEEIRVPRLWTGDTTPERLQSLLADHGERMAVLTDEGGIFEVMAGLYSDGRANLDIFLQGHAGKSVRVDRQGRMAHLNAPALSFGLAIQPAILGDFGAGGKRRFRGNGTLARFLYAIPRSNIGSRDVRASYQIPATVEAQYRAGIFDLLAVPPQMSEGKETARRLTLTPDALDCWLAFSEMIEKRQGPDGDLEPIQDWSAKLPGAALRVAGNFHLAEHGGTPPTQIEAATVERALDLCVLLIDHAKAAFAMMDADPATGDAKAILKWITKERLDQFRRGEAYRQFKGRFTGKTERLDKALRELQTRNIVTEGTEPTRGRSATIFNVNPHLWGVE